MAALSITAANVLATTGAPIGDGVAGATTTAGQPLYLDSGTNTLKLADANASAATAACVGIALMGASAGQPISYCAQDATFTPGATLVVGQTYCVGDTAGSIVPISDLASADYATVLFVAISTTQANLNVTRGGLKP